MIIALIKMIKLVWDVDSPGTEQIVFLKEQAHRLALPNMRFNITSNNFIKYRLNPLEHTIFILNNRNATLFARFDRLVVSLSAIFFFANRKRFNLEIFTDKVD